MRGDDASTPVTLDGVAMVEGDRRHRASLHLRHGTIAAQRTMRDVYLDLRDHLVFPALINAHEHLQVNNVPPLPGERTFPNAYAWIDAFQAHFDETAVKEALSVSKAQRLRHGALKNLLAGATFVAHHDPWHPALDAADFPVALLRGHGWSYALNGPDYGPPVERAFAETRADRPWMIHLAEGTDEIAAAELSELDRRGCLAANSVLVHGVGLGERDVARVIAVGAAVVWCPGSNRRLLGRTLDPRRLHAAGRLAVGSDSRLSGERDLLEELRLAWLRRELEAADLLALATTHAARILRLADRGSLAAGNMADLIIVDDRGGDAAANLVGRSRADLRAVIRHGVPRIADPDFADWFDAAGIDTVTVMLDGKPKLMACDLADPALLAMEPGLVASADTRRAPSAERVA